MRFLSFFVLSTLLFTYLAIRVARLTRAQGQARWAVYAGVFASLAAGIGTQAVYRNWTLPPDAYGMDQIALVAFTAIGFLVSIALLLIPIDVALALGKGALWLREKFWPSGVRTDRRRWVSEQVVQSAELLFLGGVGVATASGLISARRGPFVKEVEVPLGRRFNRTGRELRIAQISDLHVGPTILEGYAERVVQMTLELKPDLIVCTGDMVDGTWLQLERHVAPLARLQAPLGVFYCSGNHEYYWGGPEWIDRFARMGMKVVHNEHQFVEFDGGRIQIAGVPDPAGANFVRAHRSDPEQAVRGADGSLPEADLRILLAHRPSACFAGARAGFDLQLSGHTHAGQFFPWAIYVPLAHPYTRGLNLHEKTWVYVNAGTGYWGPPNRFAVPSEITLLRVKG
jgi:predicted MPP superfamily phosphohydrolase